MPSKNWAKVIIALFALIMLGVSLITGESIDKNGIRWISGASSAIILLLLIYDRWVWRWPLVRKIAEYSGHPVVRGTWKGTLEYSKDGDGRPGVTDIFMSIDQTYSTIVVRGFVGTSESHSLSASIDRPISNQRRLVYAYHSGAPHAKRNQNRPHDGTALLNIVGIPVEAISGSYYTDRGGTGEIVLTEHTFKLSESYKQASARKYRKLS
jgi:hypothetical protein